MSVKLDKQDFKKIKTFQSKINQLTYKIGELYLDEVKIKEALSDIQDQITSTLEDLEKLQKHYKRFADTMYQKYGEVMVDPDTGVGYTIEEWQQQSQKEDTNNSN